MKRIALYILLPIALLCSAAVADANLITNGGFETGDFTGWTEGGHVSNMFVTGPFVFAPHSGSFQSVLGPVGSDGTLSQTLATTAGGLYTVSYWLANTGGTPNDFSMSFGGVTIPGSVIIDGGAFGYTQFTFSGLLATTGSTVLEFSFRQDPGDWGLDDISVDAARGVPDTGSSMLLLGLGLVGLCLAQRTLRSQRILLIRH
ncbi:MAG TPA: VPDSG-CTERM sorting domain-containing protein [Candidatus Udaeobacter sp.]